MVEPVEKWGPGRKSLEYVVELEGAVVTKTLVSSMGTTTRRYWVDRVEVVTRWTIGQEEEGRTLVYLYCREMIGRQVISHRTTYFPQELDEVPGWLERIVTAASPRDVG